MNWVCLTYGGVVRQKNLYGHGRIGRCGCYGPESYRWLSSNLLLLCKQLIHHRHQVALCTFFVGWMDSLKVFIPLKPYRSKEKHVVYSVCMLIPQGNFLANEFGELPSWIWRASQLNSMSFPVEFGELRTRCTGAKLPQRNQVSGSAAGQPSTTDIHKQE